MNADALLCCLILSGVAVPLAAVIWVGVAIGRRDDAMMKLWQDLVDGPPPPRKEKS